MLLDQLTFGAAALSLGTLAAFIVTRGDFDGMGAGAGAILFGLLLAAFVAAPFVVQRLVNQRVRSRAGAICAGLGLLAAAGLGLAAYGTMLLAARPDALDAVLFMAVPLWQLLLVGVGFGLMRLADWMAARRA